MNKIMFHRQAFARKLVYAAILMLLIFTPLFSSSTNTQANSGSRQKHIFSPEHVKNSVGNVPTMSVTSVKRGMIDTEVDETAQQTNDGFEPVLEIGHKDFLRQRILIGPSLTKLKPNVNIVSVTLHIALCNTYDWVGIQRTLTLYQATSLWHQSLATWGKQPGMGEVVASKTITVPDVDLDGDGVVDTIYWYNFDLTDIARKWVNGEIPNYGLVMTGQESGDDSFLMFCSNDAGTLNGIPAKAELWIDYELTPPTLAASPDSLTFQSVDVPPAAQAIIISNNGSLPFNWQAGTGSAAWLHLDQTSGTLIAGDAQTITATVDPTGLSQPNVYHAQISITSSTAGVQGSPKNILVTFAYGDVSPILSAQPKALQFNTSDLKPHPAAQTVTLTNSGGSSLDWHASTGASSWMLLNLVDGTLAAHESKDITVSIDLAGQAYQSIYSGQITFTSATANVQGSPQVVDVSVNNGITPPTLSAGPQSLLFTSTDAKPTPDPVTITIHNTGGFPLNWQTGPTKPAWLNLTPSSGSIPAGASVVVTATADTTGLARSKVYSGSLSITSATQAVLGSPQTIPVTLKLDMTHVISLPLVLRPPQAGAQNQLQASPKMASLVIGIAEYQAIVETGEVKSIRSGVWPSPVNYTGLDRAKLERIENDLGEPDQAVMHLEDAQATFANIQAAIQWLDANEDASTIVIIFFSGHGGQLQIGPTTYEEFLAPYDTTMDGSNIITASILDGWLSQLESTKIVIILDSCFSGGLAGLTALPPAGVQVRAPFLLNSSSGAAPDPSNSQVMLMADSIARPGRIVMTASSASQESYEFSNLQQGLFSYYLMMALMDPLADTNHDSWVSSEEAFVYLVPQVQWFIANILDNSINQTPKIYDGVSGQVNLTRP
jgi:hypothetical protein